MSLEISDRIEARLAAKAQEQGLSVDAFLEWLMDEQFLERLVNERRAKIDALNSTTPELPTWHLGATGSLRRCDLYDDVG
jgi:hypothetical protein